MSLRLHVTPINRKIIVVHSLFIQPNILHITVLRIRKPLETHFDEIQFSMFF